MRRIWLAIRVFFAVLFHAQAASTVERALALPAPADGTAASPLVQPEARGETKKPTMAKPAKPVAVRNDAITLLSTLQREARFVDFIKESLAGFSDAEIGAVVRDVHRDCGAVLERLFGLTAVLDQQEGSTVDIPTGFDSGRFRLTGRVAGEPPFHGRLVHHGWEAAKCELPVWSGKETSLRVVAPAEVEL